MKHRSGREKCVRVARDVSPDSSILIRWIWILYLAPLLSSNWCEENICFSFLPFPFLSFSSSSLSFYFLPTPFNYIPFLIHDLVNCVFVNYIKQSILSLGNPVCKVQIDKERSSSVRVREQKVKRYHGKIFKRVRERERVMSEWVSESLLFQALFAIVMSLMMVSWQHWKHSMLIGLWLYSNASELDDSSHDDPKNGTESSHSSPGHGCLACVR